MRTLLSAAALVAAALPAPAQNQSIVFCGRFPFVSLDAVNERVGGSITMLEEFDFSYNTPGIGSFARSLQPSTAHQAFLGDADNDGNYTKFAGFKTYFERINVAGLFMRAADKATPSPDKVFWTVRDAVATLAIEVFTTNGTAVHVVRPGDFVRFTGNGNVEFFITQDQIMAAAGPQTGTFALGASAICQDSAGNLYYSPAEGGHWIRGNNFTNANGNRVFANDGSIVMIDAASITYDAAGNVQAVAADSAHILWEEIDVGPLTGQSIRAMVTNAGHQTINGTPSTFANMVALDLDPNGGTLQAAFPVGDVPNQVVYNVPHFVFGADNGTYGGTIFSTQNNGSIATINGVLCGSNTPGVAPTGAHLGVAVDVANFQPTVMGFCIVNAIPTEPLVLDMPNFGALNQAAQQPTWDVDVHGAVGQVVFLQVAFGPFAAGSFAPAVPTAALPPVIAPGSYPFTFASIDTLGFRVTDGFGYATWSFANPHTGPFAGTTLVLQAAGLVNNQFQVSNPVQMQLK